VFLSFVKGAYDAAWWPGILNTLKEFKCPKNLCNLAKGYFSERTAILTTNSVQMEREVTKGCPKSSCCGPGYVIFNITHYSTLNLKNEPKL
jgi:hypothetical protein